MSRNIDILFEKNRKTYPPGATIAGVLLIRADRVISHVQQIVIICLGEARVYWTEGDKSSQIHISNEEYLNEEAVLLDGKKLKKVLPKGQHRYPFTFLLPKVIPPSFKLIGAATASVCYTMKAVIKRGMFSKSIENKREFFVEGRAGVERSHWNDLQPSVGRGSHFLCCLLCKSGPINAELITDKRKYVAGETMRLHVNLENLSTRKVTTKLSLVLRAMLRTTNKSKLFKQSVVALDCNSQCARGALSAEDYVLAIPLTYLGVPLAPSGLRHCNIIDVSYAVELQVLTGRCHKNLGIRAKIQIVPAPGRASTMSASDLRRLVVPKSGSFNDKAFARRSASLPPSPIGPLHPSTMTLISF